MIEIPTVQVADLIKNLKCRHSLTNPWASFLTRKVYTKFKLETKLCKKKFFREQLVT